MQQSPGLTNPQELLAAINQLRTNPPSFVPLLEKRIKQYDGVSLKLENGQAFVTTEGKRACNDALTFLKLQSGVPALALCPKLQNLAKTYSQQQIPFMQMSSIPQTSGFTALMKSCDITSNLVVVLKAGASGHASNFFINLLVDDGFERRPNRSVLFASVAQVGFEIIPMGQSAIVFMAFSYGVTPQPVKSQNRLTSQAEAAKQVSTNQRHTKDRQRSSSPNRGTVKVAVETPKPAPNSRLNSSVPRMEKDSPAASSALPTKVGPNKASEELNLNYIHADFKEFLQSQKKIVEDLSKILHAGVYKKLQELGLCLLSPRSRTQQLVGAHIPTEFVVLRIDITLSKRYLEFKRNPKTKPQTTMRLSSRVENKRNWLLEVNIIGKSRDREGNSVTIIFHHPKAEICQDLEEDAIVEFVSFEFHDFSNDVDL